MLSLWKDFSFSLLTEANFQCFLLIRRTIVFYKFSLDLPILWHASMSSVVTYTFVPLPSKFIQFILNCLLLNWINLGFKIDDFFLQLISCTTQWLIFILHISNHNFFENNYFVININEPFFKNPSLICIIIVSWGDIKVKS